MQSSLVLIVCVGVIVEWVVFMFPCTFLPK